MAETALAPPHDAIAGPAIRAARATDLPAIVGVYNEAVVAGTSTCDLSAIGVEERRDWLERHRRPYGVWVADVDGDVCGWVAVSAYDAKPCFRRTAFLSTYVSERSRRRGIGRTLRRHAIGQARAGGFHTILSRVWSTNVAMLGLVRESGWSEVAHLREVIERDGRFIDCHLFQLILD